jgi:LysR family glycine cleavage system transcriptional activator
VDHLPPLNPLRAFEAAARHGSVRRAAEELRVTPGAVSRQVQVLESHLGVQLFRRTANQMVLTASGEQYFEAIAPHFDGLREASRRLTGRRGSQVLKVRAYTTFAMKWLIPKLSDFQQLDRTVQVQLTTSLENVDFEREDVDCAIRLGEGAWPGLEADRLVPNELIPVCSPAYQAKLRLTQPGDLVSAQLLHSLARPDDWRLWLEAAGLHNVDPYEGARYASSALVLQAVAAGQGIMIAQKALVVDDLASGQLVQPFGPTLNRGQFTYYLVYPANRLRSRALRHFRKWLLERSE